MAAVVAEHESGTVQCLISGKTASSKFHYLEVLVLGQSFRSKNADETRGDSRLDGPSLTARLRWRKQPVSDGTDHAGSWDRIWFDQARGDTLITRAQDSQDIDLSRGLPQTLCGPILLRKLDLRQICNGTGFESGTGFEPFDEMCSQSGVEVVRVHIPLHKMAASLGKLFSSPEGSRYQFKTIQVNEDKRTSVGSSLAEKISFPRSTFWLEAHGSSWL